MPARRTLPEDLPQPPLIRIAHGSVGPGRSFTPQCHIRNRLVGAHDPQTKDQNTYAHPESGASGPPPAASRSHSSSQRLTETSTEHTSHLLSMQWALFVQSARPPPPRHNATPCYGMQHGSKKSARHSRPGRPGRPAPAATSPAPGPSGRKLMLTPYSTATTGSFVHFSVLTESRRPMNKSAQSCIKMPNLSETTKQTQSLAHLLRNPAPQALVQARPARTGVVRARRLHIHLIGSGSVLW
jgi:hypothetical protein